MGLFFESNNMSAPSSKQTSSSVIEPVVQRHSGRELQQSYGGHMSGPLLGNKRSNRFCNPNGLAQCLIKQRLRDVFGQYLQME
jgi:hypothetical protein